MPKARVLALWAGDANQHVASIADVFVDGDLIVDHTSTPPRAMLWRAGRVNCVWSRALTIPLALTRRHRNAFAYYADVLTAIRASDNFELDFTVLCADEGIVANCGSVDSRWHSVLFRHTPLGDSVKIVFLKDERGVWIDMGYTGTDLVKQHKELIERAFEIQYTVVVVGRVPVDRTSIPTVRIMECRDHSWEEGTAKPFDEFVATADQFWPQGVCYYSILSGRRDQIAAAIRDIESTYKGMSYVHLPPDRTLSPLAPGSRQYKRVFVDNAHLRRPRQQRQISTLAKIFYWFSIYELLEIVVRLPVFAWWSRKEVFAVLEATRASIDRLLVKRSVTVDSKRSRTE